MRKIKSLMLVALTLIMGLTMTSCLNSDGTESQWDTAPIVRVYSLMGNPYFVDSAGTVYHPSASSVSKLEGNGFSFSEVDYAFVYLKYVDEETTLNSDASASKDRDVDVVAILPLDGEDVVVSQTKADMDIDAPETAPIVALSFGTGDGYYNSVYPIFSQPLLFDLETVIISSRFNLTNDQEEYKKHKLVLAYCAEDVQPGSTDLVLYYRHDKGTDDGTEVISDETHCYNIAEVLTSFESIAGNEPTKIIIKAHEDTYQTGDMPEEYTDYEIEYKDPAEQNSQN